MNETCKRTTIGGQALIEGILMIGPVKKAIAVRQPDGDIALEYLNQKPPTFWEKIPFIRGSIKLVRQLILGTRALMRSAEISLDEEAEETAEAETKTSFWDKHSDVALTLTAIFGLAFSILIFILLPNVIVDLIRKLAGIELDGSASQQLWLTLIEGIIRVIIFLVYLWITSKMKDIKRVWQYHGAEHKTIFCYESGKPMTVENAREFTRFHPRCGTSFMFLVMIISVLVFSLVGWRVWYLNLIFRLLLLPVVAGISYEIIRWAGRYDNALTAAISKPGLWLQRLTTKEPDDSMLEVAICAMEAVIPEDKTSDIW